MLNGLDLFSGIGGMSVALRNYVRPIAYCEIDPYCQGVLLNRMHDSALSIAPIWDDIRTFYGWHLKHGIDILYGGFHCQDISVAGHGKGLDGERSGLYWQIHRLAKEILPKFIFLENVPAICTKGGWNVVSSLAEMGYDCRWCVISAASVGALHRRERWFLLANAQSSRLQGQWPIASGLGAAQPQSSCNSNDGNDNSQSSKQEDSRAESEQNVGKTWRGHTGQYWPFESRADWQETVSRVRRVSDGISNRVDRIKALGNAVVPIQTKTAFEMLMGFKNE